MNECSYVRKLHVYMFNTLDLTPRSLSRLEQQAINEKNV
jgi:hypothetical protein